MCAIPLLGCAMPLLSKRRFKSLEFCVRNREFYQRNRLIHFPTRFLGDYEVYILNGIQNSHGIWFSGEGYSSIRFLEIITGMRV